MEIKEYYCLLRKFLDSNISIDEFVYLYSSTLRNETRQMDREVFAVLEDLFEDVDAYVPELLPEKETSLAITKDTLIVEINIAFEKLKDLLENSNIQCE